MNSDMLMDFLKAIAVGVAASAPIGPIAILVIQKTLSKGMKAGFVTSLGATVVDAVFAIIAIFSLAYVQSFMADNSILILIVGGAIVAALGLSMALSNPFRKLKAAEEHKRKKSYVSPTDFLTACAMGFSNPGAIAVMFALMAMFGLADGEASDWSCFPIVLGIAGGSMLYWLFVTFLLNIFRKQFNMKTIIWINRITGAIVIIVGLAMLAEGLKDLLI